MFELIDRHRPLLPWIARGLGAISLCLAAVFSYQLLMSFKSSIPQVNATSNMTVTAASTPDYRNHAMAAASEHIFGNQSLIPLTMPESADSPYTISGIVCTETAADACDPAQAAVATVIGPGGEIFVQAGSKLANGDTVQTIEPMGITVAGAAGAYKLALKIPMASANQITTVLPVDGAEVALVATGPVHSAPAPPPADTLNANLARLQAMLQEARQRNKVGSPSPPESMTKN